MFDFLDAVFRILFSSIWNFLLFYFSGVVAISVCLILYAKYKKTRSRFERYYPLVIGSWVSVVVLAFFCLMFAFIWVLMGIWLGLCKLFKVEP